MHLALRGLSTCVCATHTKLTNFATLYIQFVHQNDVQYKTGDAGDGVHPTDPTSDEFQYELELQTEDDQVFQMWNICLVNMVGFGAITRTGAFVRGGAGAAGRGGGQDGRDPFTRSAQMPG